jgi:DMSO/TMAO reductase YedYZ molybdopterin-dependent catalytic subunit/thiosulfate reductase cytochrome b subunit
MEHSRFNELHFPPDRRRGFGIKPVYVCIGLTAAFAPVVLAWLQYLVVGLPEVPASPKFDPLVDPHGFPAWIRLAHFVNIFFLVLLFRSGLSILADHPRLYWNNHCTPGTDWIRFTPITVPTDRVWTARDDCRYVSPWIGLPGYRHTIGIGRHWHFLSAFFWLANGLIFVVLLFATNQWKRLVPVNPQTFSDAWAVFVHYSTFHMPVEPDGFYRYNALQQLAYFGVVFILAPISVLTGLAMSPSIDDRYGWYPNLFGGRQSARSIHFLALCGYVAFLIPHVGMVVLTGLQQNMNHIVLGTDNTGPLGLWLGCASLAGVVAFCFFANWLSWAHPRLIQITFRKVLGPLQRRYLNSLESRVEYTDRDISPYFWVNGALPTTAEWKALAADSFQDFRLKVTGLVENPVELSLADMRALGQQDQITMHHCIQGWSGIAHWGGLPLAKLMEVVRPLPEAKVVVFYSFGAGLYGNEYYDTLTLQNARHHQSILAYEMNHHALPELYGAPLRLRAENQLGFKQVKWIREVAFVASEKTVGLGWGGRSEDDEYFPVVANI